MTAGLRISAEAGAPYPYRCTECGRVGTRDDGIRGIGDECPDEECGGIIVSTDPDPVIVRSDDDDSPWLLDMRHFALSRFYLTAAEALAFAEWLDNITGGGNDLAENIREAVWE